MKNQLETKANSYKNVIIQDENGLDTIKVRKDLFFANLASHLRQISATTTPVKALA